MLLWLFEVGGENQKKKIVKEKKRNMFLDTDKAIGLFQGNPVEDSVQLPSQAV